MPDLFVRPRSRSAIARVACSCIPLLLALAAPGRGASQVPADMARDFLASRQLASGAFPGALIVDTAVASEVLDGTQRAAALYALAVSRPDNAEAGLSRLLALLGTPYLDPMEKEAWRQAVARGELGLAPGAVAVDGIVLARALSLAARDPEWAPLLPQLLAQATIQLAPGGASWADNGSDPTVVAELATSLVDVGAPGDAARLAALSVLAQLAVSGSASWPAADIALAVRAAAGMVPFAEQLLARLQSMQAGDGSLDGGDVRSTALAGLALRYALPDLTVSLPLTLDRAPVSGQPYAFNARVTNVGRYPSPATTLEATVADAGGILVHRAAFDVPPLAAGSVTSVPVSLGVQGAPGARTATLVANPLVSFSESTTANNLVRLAYRVADLPDLVVEPADISLSPSPATLYETSAVTVRIRNQGDGVAPAVRAQLFQGDPAAGGTLLAEDVYLNLTAGVPRLLRGKVTPRSLETFSLFVRLDPENAVPEAREDNNQISVTMTPVNPTEVIMDARASVSANRTGVIPLGTPVSIHMGVGLSARRFANEYPSAQVGPVEVSLTMTPPGGGSPLEVIRTTVGMQVAYSCTTSCVPSGFYAPSPPIYTLPIDAQAGIYTFTATVDPRNLLGDVNLGNNTASATVELTGSDAAELWVDPASALVSPLRLIPGRPSTVSARVGNSGTREAALVRVDAVMGSTTLTTVLPLLSPGESQLVSFSVTHEQVAPTGGVTLRVDPLNEIPETTETNNQTSIGVVVTSSDVAMRFVGQPVDPAPVGPAAVVEFELRNNGAAATYGGAPLTVTRGGYTYATTYVPSLAPGETRIIAFGVPTAGIVGSVRLDAQFGGATTVPFTLRVTNPDFRVSAGGIALTPEQSPLNEPVTARVAVDNLGPLGGTTSVRLYRGYPENGDLAASGTLLVAAGGSAVFQTEPFLLPAAPPYVVTVVLDEEQALLESSEGNNSATRPTLKRPGETVVAFDETHGPGATVALNEDGNIGGFAGGLTEYAADLRARGYSVSTLNPSDAGLTPALLQGVDVVVGLVPSRVYRSDELQVLGDYVRGGGGFFFLGDWGGQGVYQYDNLAWAPPVRQICSMLGIRWVELFVFAGGPASAWSQPFSRSAGGILSHPITTGVDALLGLYVGGFDNLPSEAATLVRSPPSWQVPNVIVSAAFPLGSGRVVVHGDSNAFDADFSGPSGGGMWAAYRTSDNARFGLQVIDWLAGLGSQATFGPDLAFVPSAIQTPAATVTEGSAVPLTVKVRNLGGAAADATVVRMYDGPAGSRLVGEMAVPGLAVDQEVELVFTWDSTGLSGLHALTAVVDPDSLVQEFNEGNNTATVVVTAQKRADLRVDATDIRVVPGVPPSVRVRVHNQGIAAVPAGGTLALSMNEASGARASASVPMPAVPAAGAITVSTTWAGAFPTDAFRLGATARVPEGTLDCDPTNDSAEIRFEPPRLDVAAPLDGTVWGGVKSLRWEATSETRPSLVVHAAIGKAGGAFTGLGTAAAGVDLDTRSYADGDYLIRVTAADGLQATTREVPLRIDNASASVRAFGAVPGTPSVTLPAVGGAATVAVPAGARVVSASVLVDAVGAATTPIGSTPVYDYGGSDLFEFAGRLHFIYLRSSTIYRQSSADDGATWSAPEQLSPLGMTVYAKRAVVNSRGIHLVYQQQGPPRPVYYMRSEDGVAFGTPRLLHSTDYPLDLVLGANEDGLALAVAGTPLQVAWARADGETWSSLSPVAGLTGAYAGAQVAAGRLHLVYGGGANPLLYRSVDLSQPIVALASAPAVTLSDGNQTNSVYLTTVLAAGGGLHVLYEYYVPWMQARLQRCPLVRDCTVADSWLLEFLALSPAAGVSGTALRALESGGIRFTYTLGGSAYFANGLDGGRSWTEPYAGWLPALSESGTYFGQGFTARAGRQNALDFARWPRLTPRDVILDVGNDEAPEHSQAGMAAMPSQLDDLAAAINAYLSNHGDADDGAVDGMVAVPVAMAGAGAGSTVLRNLEVRYLPASAFAGLADPPLFSPGQSPGILDGTVLSTLAAGDISVTSAAGVVRSLATNGASGRWAASWDGRDAGGAVSPSGIYGFGTAGGPAVATVEIDDIPPLARLDAGAEGSHGGMAAIRGLATDQDWAGTAKNFARYQLDYSVDGTTWSAIASGSSPVDGILGRWDTGKVGASIATLRLTVRDRAGNTTVDARTVGVSPGAPLPPVITSPTVAGTPVDLAGSTTAIGGTAEPGTTVTVYRDGLSVGTAACDGRWTLAGVSLPPGVSRFTASATRGTLESARSQPVLVGQYALALSISAPGHTPAGTVFPATLSVQRTAAVAAPVRVRLTALDSAGQAVPFALTPRVATLVFAATGSSTLAVAVDPGITIPGSYRLKAEVISGSLVPAFAEATVVLDSSVQLQAGLVSDKEAYDSLQLVSLTARVANTGTGSSGTLSATIAVSDPTGQTTMLGPTPITSLAPLGSRVLSALYGLPPLRTGSYLAILEVRDELGAVMASSQTSFLVRPASGAGSLLGTLLVNPGTYATGDALQVSFTVTNRGQAASVPVSVLLLSQATSAVVARWDGTMLLAADAQSSGSASLSTASADGQALVAVLLGNGRALAAQAVEPAPFRDTSPPVITITGVTEDEYRPGPVTPVIAISDESPFTSTTTLDTLSYVSGTPVTAEGRHELLVQATDAWNNSAPPATRSFTIDTIPPEVVISGVHDGALLRPPVVPAVTFRDDNLRSTRLQLDSVDWTSGSAIGAEGTHFLDAWADDRAGNQTPAPIHFVLDGTPPAIEVLGVTDGELTRDTVFPVVRITDLHPGTEAVYLDDAPWDGLPVSTEGDHRLRVEATDAAGNAAPPVAVGFTIDRTPPAISVAGVIDGMLVNRPVTPVIAISELHPGTTQAFLGLAPWAGGTVAAEGSHQLRVESVDAAGNPAVPVVLSFTIDTTPPRITIGGVVDGQVARDALIPVVTVTELHPGAIDVRLDGSPFVSDTPVTGEGDHLLVANATDAAGNAAVPAQVHFTRDTVPPVVTITGVAQGGIYAEAWPGYTVSDLHPGTATATLDSQPFVDGSAVRAPGTHTFAVSAIDAAGNPDSASVTFEVVGTGPQATVTALLDSSSPRVLVGLDCSCKPTGCEDSQAKVLKGALTAAGIPVEFAGSNAELITKMREHRHNVRVLYLVGQTAIPAFRELREMTFEGGGLVVVDDYGLVCDASLTDTVGAITGTKVSKVGTVSFLAGDLGPARSVAMTGAAAMQTLKAATAIAAAKTTKGIVASTNRYGLGRVVTLTLNPEANDKAAVKEVLVAAVRFAASGTPRPAVPRAPLYVKLDSGLTSPAGPVDLRLDAWTGAGLSPLSDAGLPVVPPRTWNFSLSAGNTDSRSFGVIAQQGGTFPVLGELTAVGPPPQLIASSHVDVVVLGPAPDLAQAAIAAAQAIPAGIKDSAKSAALAHLASVNTAPATAGACDTSITGVLDATDDLKLIGGPEAAAARLKTDQLLRALQALRAALP